MAKYFQLSSGEETLGSAESQSIFAAQPAQHGLQVFQMLLE
jgi:hypothetical protein